MKNKRSEANYQKQLDFAYAQLLYWKELAAANKMELNYYRGLTEKLQEIIKVQEEELKYYKDKYSYNEEISDASDFNEEDFLDEEIPLSQFDINNKDEEE